MILVDSCVWIDLLKDVNTPEVQFLGTLLDQPIQEICTSHIIYFEVLRGISSDLERKKVANRLKSFQFFDFANENFDSLIDIYRKCRQSGFTLAKLGDWLVLKTALDHALELLSSDGDFRRLNRIYPIRLVSL